MLLHVDRSTGESLVVGARSDRTAGESLVVGARSYYDIT